jgi:hypothetical protein
MANCGKKEKVRFFVHTLNTLQKTSPGSQGRVFSPIPPPSFEGVAYSQETMTMFTHSKSLEDKFEIIDLILRFAYALDQQNWSMLRDCLADQVDADYAALRGETRHIVSADDFVSKRSKDLSGLKTQHISTNHLVSVQTENQAECTSCFLIHRLDPTRMPDGNTYDTAGHYVHGLAHAKQGWRIDRIKQTVLWSRGNPDIHGVRRRH